MATIRIEDFPDELYKAIEERARKNNRSISEEVIEALRDELELISGGANRTGG